jgi:hypothetical protein
MRFSSKTFKKRASRKVKKTRKSKTRKQKGGTYGSILYRDIPKGAKTENPIDWDA